MPARHTAPDFQPFMRLAQKNFALVARFSMSPEVMSQATATAQAVAERAPESAARLAGSAAWSELMQGLVRNYTEFMAEMAQAVVAALAGVPATAAAGPTPETAPAAVPGLAARR